MTTPKNETSFVHAPQVTFRAHRNYVHSTTLYEELISGAKKLGLQVEGPIALKIRRLLTKQPEFHYALGAESFATDAPADFSFRADGLLCSGNVFEREVPVSEREPYDETPILRCVKQRGRAIWLIADTGLRPIEAITALNLLLHQKLFTTAPDRKWYLARIELKRTLNTEDARAIKIKLNSSIGTSITRSSITAGDEPIGQLEFMLGRV